jgi:hypothetical protein
VRFRGTVTLTYPGGAVTLTDLTVVVAGPRATLRATVRGAWTRIGDLGTYGVPPRTSDRTRSWTQVPAALSAAGAAALPRTSEGTEVGPLNWSITLEKAAAAPATDGGVSLLGFGGTVTALGVCLMLAARRNGSAGLSRPPCRDATAGRTRR